jgi:hypothetical protein
MLLIERLVSAGTALAMRRTLAERVFPLQLDSAMKLEADDTILLARIFAAGAIGFSLDRVLGFYRRHNAHRFGLDDLSHLLNREADVSKVLARMFATQRVPSVAFKYDAIVGALDGAHWWDQRRLGNYLSGLRSAIALWKRPKLCARQAAALTFGFVAPALWIERFKRSQSFYEPNGRSPLVSGLHASQ